MNTNYQSKISQKTIPLEITATELNSLHSDLTTLLILATLKNFSTKEYPLKSSEIHSRMQELYGSYVKDLKSVKRKLNALEYLTSILDHSELLDSDTSLYEPEENIKRDLTNEFTLNGNIAYILRQTCNGILRTVQEKEGKLKKYYFEPLLMDSHLDMLSSSVISNQYLSDEERNYMLNAISSLAPFSQNQNNDTAFHLNESLSWPELCSPETVKPFATDNPSFALLERINLLYQAVTKGYKVAIKYGIYKREYGKKTPILTSKEKELELHPYALLFNNGRHYLIATQSTHKDPGHFRVDRIYHVKFLPDPDDARIPAKRNPLPDSLRPYFKGETFLQEKYTKTYPLMTIYHEINIINATLQGNDRALNILIDYLGKNNLRIISDPKDSNLEYRITVNAQYEALVNLCAQQHSLITVISPRNLIEDVTSKLKESLEKYIKN